MKAQSPLLALLTLILGPVAAIAAPAFPVITDPNADGLLFTGTNVFSFGAYGVDVSGPYIAYNQNFNLPCCHGAGFSTSVSNGENGIDQSLDGGSNQDVNLDIPNETPANSVFAAIGNPSGKLENGNVIRASAWFRKDPANPISVDPQVQPVLKLELWKEALSGNQDTNGGVQPLFGDKVFDQDQHGGALGIPAVDRAQWIDLDGDGQVNDGEAAGQGRVSSLSTSAWTLVEVSYTVNELDWLGIADDIYTVADIEEIRATMFMGDFAGTNLTGDGDGGNLLVDNLLVEVFRDAASVTANTNPTPPLNLGGLPGDANADGSVDLLDLDILGANFGLASGGTVAQGDFNEDGAVDLLDLDILGANFGTMGASAAAVPEPASLVGLVTLGLLAASRRRG